MYSLGQRLRINKKLILSSPLISDAAKNAFAERYKDKPDLMIFRVLEVNSSNTYSLEIEEGFIESFTSSELDNLVTSDVGLFEILGISDEQHPLMAVDLLINEIGLMCAVKELIEHYFEREKEHGRYYFYSGLSIKAVPEARYILEANLEEEHINFMEKASEEIDEMLDNYINKNGVCLNTTLIATNAAIGSVYLLLMRYSQYSINNFCPDIIKRTIIKPYACSFYGDMGKVDFEFYDVYIEELFKQEYLKYLTILNTL